MKTLYIVLLALLCSLPSYGQRNVNRLISKVKKNDSAIALTLPGWLMRSAFEVAQDDDFKIEKGYQDIVDGIKKLRVVIIPEELKETTDQINEALLQIKDKEGYEDYATVKDKGTLIRVMVKEKKNRIRNLVVVFNDDESMAILNILTDLDLEDLKKADLSFNKL